MSAAAFSPTTHSTTAEPSTRAALDAAHLQQARFNMVEQQIRTWDVLDFRVLEVLHSVPREAFVRAEHAGLAYADTALPLPAGAGHLFKPVIDGRVLQAAGLTGDEDVLEIGTGSGYTTACLAKLARRVRSIDRQSACVEFASRTLRSLDVHNVAFETCDALSGFTPQNKFNVIVLGAAVTAVPANLLAWLEPKGRIFAVRGFSPVMEAVCLSAMGGKTPHTQSLFETDLPYLVGAEPAAPKFQL